MFIRDYDFIHNIDVLFEKTVILYGIGYFGERFAKLLNDNSIAFDCFCDKNESKKEYFNHPVITLAELKKKTDQEDCMIIIASRNWCEDIITDLVKMEIKAYVCTWYGFQTGIELHIENEHFSENYRDDFLARKKMWMQDNRLIIFLEYHMRLCRNPNAIFVYQPGKVGSTSVFQMLQKAGIDVVHIHLLTRNTGIQWMDERYASIVNSIKKNGVKIITMVREPVARALSAFMQSFSTDYVQGFSNDFVLLEDSRISFDIEKEACRWMINVLKEDREFKWFDEELKELTGIDIYQYPFHKEQGYGWIKEGNKEILLLKLEKLRDNIDIIEKFTGKENLILENDNAGCKKQYKYVYEKLKQVIRIPEEILEHQYKTDNRMDYFYMKEEKEKFFNKWKR